MNYLIASHGEYAAGLASAVTRLAGQDKKIYTLCAYTDGTPMEERMQALMAGHEEERWIIFTDLLGGSVNQYMMQKLMKPGCHILTGINLELILSVLRLEETDDLDSALAACVGQAREQICYVNSLMEKKGRDA